MKNNLLKKAVAISLLGTIGLYSMPVFANTKEEKVYSKINNNGEKYETIVSAKLSNDNSSELLADISDLINIKNTNGDETFEKIDNNVIWKANGKEIQYQGETDKELPITATIKYELNGEEKTAEEIVGETGRVKVTINYKNNDAHTVKVNGKYVRMYTPFVVVAGTIIDDEKNSNIEITNGKILDNGNKLIAIGMCMPGLSESLDVSSNDIEIPSSITIEMDTEDFEMNSIMSYATAKMLEESDIKVFDKLDEIYDKANTLSEASAKLVDGTNQLKDGTAELNNGASTLKSGMHDALSGAQLITSTVKTSAKTLKEDKTAALTAEMIASIGNTAAKQAVAGVKATQSEITKTADAGIDARKDDIYNQAVASAKQIAEQTALSTAQSILETATETGYQTTLTAVNKTAGDTAETIMKQVVVSSILQTVNGVAPTDAQVVAMITALEKNEAPAAIQAAYTAQKAKIDSAKQSAISTAEKSVKASKPTAVALTDAQKKSIIEEADKGVEKQRELIGSQMLASSKQIAEQTASATALSVAETVGNNVGQSVAENVANEVKTQALSKVAESMEQLTAGLGELENGLTKLDEGTASLTDGTNSLKEGAETLAEGMSQFNEDGIQKIVNYVNGDVKELQERAEALKDLAANYNTFGGLKQGDKGEVTFITIFDSLKKENFEKEEQNTSNSTETNQTVSEEKESNTSNKTQTSSN